MRKLVVVFKRLPPSPSPSRRCSTPAQTTSTCMSSTTSHTTSPRSYPPQSTFEPLHLTRATTTPILLSVAIDVEPTFRTTTQALFL